MEKRLNKSTQWATDGGTTGAKPATNEVKDKGHIVIPYTQGLCESIKRSVVGMAFKPTSKVAEPLRASWSLPTTKTLWST